MEAHPPLEHNELMPGSDNSLRPDGLREMLPRPDPPTTKVIGRSTEEVASHYRAAGFEVELIDLSTDWAVSLDLDSGRIRIYHREGRVESVHQG
jgi:hypothetical protein